MTTRAPDDTASDITLDEARQMLETQNRELIIQQKQLLAAADQLETLNEKLHDTGRMRDDFVSMVVHELRNPLASVMQSIDVVFALEGGQLPAQTRHYLDVALRNAKRINRILSDLLDLAKMEAGRLAVDLDLVLPSEAMEEARLAYEADAAEAKVALVVEAGMLPPVMADAMRLAQILSNLISNAIKHTPAGGRVQVTADATENDVLFSVTDTGSGIRREFHEVIFEKYRQLASHEGGGKRGTGLGLPICRSLVRLHGGTIGVESEPGKGACFSFTIPLYTLAGRLAAIAPQLVDHPPAGAWRIDLAGDLMSCRAACHAIRGVLRAGEWIVSDPRRKRVWILCEEPALTKRHLDEVSGRTPFAGMAYVDLPGAADPDLLARIVDKD